MNLSIATDYFTDAGCPEPYLKRIAEAGFTHIHWCHQWQDDFYYSRPEVDQIAHWLRTTGLKLLDLHATAGREKSYASVHEYERQSGVELIVNRLTMMSRLGGDAIVLHLPAWPADSPEAPRFQSQMLRSFDELQRHSHRLGVRVAIENQAGEDFGRMRALFRQYGPEFMGLCYDSGHGNIGGEGLDHLEAVKDRLYAVHLHDNDGSADQHRLPFSASVDWERLAAIVAVSAYRKRVSLEVSMRNCGFRQESVFLGRAYRAAARLALMIDRQKTPDGGRVQAKGSGRKAR